MIETELPNRVAAHSKNIKSTWKHCLERTPTLMAHLVPGARRVQVLHTRHVAAIPGTNLSVLSGQPIISSNRII